MGETKPTEETPKVSKQDKFREEQKREAEAQNLTGENAVPEQRPQAFNTPPDSESELRKRLVKEGVIDDKPMPQSAYERAQKNVVKPEDKDPEDVRTEAAHVGTVVEVLSGPHRGRFGSVLRVVSYPTVGDHLKKAAGYADSDYIKPAEVEVRFRGDSRDGEMTVLDLTQIEYKVLTDGAYSGRAFVSGASA